MARASRHLNNVIPPGPEGLVWWLTVLASVGVTSVIPLLPLYAQENGAVHVIGLMAAAYLVTNLVFLYGAGRLSDLAGRRPLMGAGLFTYACCSIGFLLWPTPTGFIVLRAIEGIAAACFLPAALAYVADRYPAEQRGLRISQLAIAENLGLLLGPAFGGIVNIYMGMDALFVLLTGMCGVGAVMVAYLPVVKATPHHAEPPPPSHWGDVRRLLLAGVSSRAFAGGFAFGLYITVWPIYLSSLGASEMHVALSWTLFAVPAVLFGPWPGRIIDRSGPGRSAVLGALFSAFVVGAYALTQDFRVILALCMLEGIGFAFAYPAQNMLGVQTAPEDMRGRVIGLITAVKTFGTLLGALAAPLLFARSPATLFVTTSVVLLLGAAALAACMALEHRGRPPAPPSPPAPSEREGAPIA